MSTIEYSVQDDLVRVPIGRRIFELMQEKGDSFSIRAFAPRLGISREYLRLMLVGERPITPSTLERIAHGLGCSVERLIQMDTVKQEQELISFFKTQKRTKPMMNRANKIALDLAEIAKGITEVGFSLHNLGKVQYLQKQYDAAHGTWLRTLGFANKLLEQYEDTKLLHLVTANLMMTYTIRKEYSKIDDLLSVVEKVFSNDHLKLGMAEYTRMKIQEERGNLEQAKEHSYLSYQYLEQTNDDEQIGHGLINIAHCEYRLGNYDVSAKMLKKAVSILNKYDNILVVAVKEYAKSLLQLQEYESVVSVVEKYSAIAKDYPDYWGKLQIMYSSATNNPSYAEAVTNNENVSMKVRYYACRSLMEFYTLNRDFESVVRYYERSRIFSNTKSEFLNEGGF